MERDYQGESFGIQPEFEHEAIAHDNPDFYHGIPELTAEEKVRMRIAEIRLEVAEIQREHESEDAAIRNIVVVRDSLEAVRGIEEAMEKEKTKPREDTKGTFVSMEYIKLERDLQRCLNSEPEYLKIHRLNTAIRNERLRQLHGEYLILIGQKS